LSTTVGVCQALSKLSPVYSIVRRSSPKRIQGPDQQNLRLQFRNKLNLPLFTGSKVEGEQSSPIHVVLQNAETGQLVTTGPEASAKLEIVVLEGDFTADDDDNWAQEDFENFVVRERDGKRPLLTGELSVALKDGVGALGELTFTDNSSWIRSRKFRLGVKIASGTLEGIRIREAKTEAFTGKDRGECTLCDLELWSYDVSMSHFESLLIWRFPVILLYVLSSCILWFSLR
jgi:hypothetical protein